jgi:hypothetical protein
MVKKELEKGRFVLRFAQLDAIASSIVPSLIRYFSLADADIGAVPDGGCLACH